MALDEDKYKKLFESRFGAGSFDTGLSQARDIGRTTAQAKIAKEAYKDYQSKQKKKAENKTYSDAVGVFSDPYTKEEIKKRGAVRIANEILNDPAKQEEIKAAGYSIDEYIDGLYSAASDGKFRSQREYDQFQKGLINKTKIEQKERDEEYKSKYGMGYEDYWEFQKEQKKAKSEKTKKEKKEKEKKEDSSFWGKTKDFFTGKDTDGDGDRDGLFGFLDSTAGRMSEAAQKFMLGDEFVNAQNKNYASNAERKLKENPDNQRAKQSQQMLNTATRPAENGLEKGADIAGLMAGAIAPYTIGGAYGAADALLGKVGLNAIKSPLAKDLVRGIGAGTIAGTEREIANKVASDDKIEPKNIALEAAFAGGGDAALGALFRNLNLKGQLGQLMNDTGAKPFNADDFQRGLQEAFAPKGNPTNVLADTVPSYPKPFETQYPGLTGTSKAVSNTMDNFITNQVPTVDAPPVLDDWFNFAQSGKTPTARGTIPKVNVSSGERELVGNQAESILNRSNALNNAPEGGYNQRLLNVQKDMQVAMDKRGLYRQPLSPDELYTQVKQPNDPATFDELIKLAGLENNASIAPKSTTDLKTMLHTDPKVNEALQALNQLGRTSPTQQPTANTGALDEMLRLLNQSRGTVSLPNGSTVNIPELAPNNQNVFQRLNELFGNKTTPIESPVPVTGKSTEITTSPTTSPSTGRDYEPITAGVEEDPELARVADELLDSERQASGDMESFRNKVNRKPEKTDKLEFLRNLRTQFVDDVAPLENLEKKIAGKVDSAENSLYKQARLFKGSPEKAHLLVKEQLNPILKDLQTHNLSYQDLGDYALAVHAKDVNDLGINSGFTNAEIDDVIRELGTPEMEAIRKNLLAVNNNVLDILQANGIINDVQVTAMREKFPNYVSLFRAFDDDKVDFASGVSKAMANASSPIKKLKGSNRAVIDPMESVIKNIFKATNTVDKNKVAQQVAKLAEQDTEGAFIRKVANSEDASRLNVVSVMENGKKVKYEVPPEVYTTLMNLDKESTNTLIKILQKPASLLRAGATLTPEFSLRNPLRDVPNAFVVSESGFNPIIDFPVGLWQSIWKGRPIKIGNKEFKLSSGDLYKEFIKENGGYGNIISMDRKLHQETLKKALTEVNTHYVDVLDSKTYTALLKKFANPLNTLRTIADVSETATKVGEFRAAKRSGASPQEAAYRARDIMDFGRAGVSVREANKVVAFLNANIQGKSKLYRAFKENPVKFTGKAVAAVTIPTIGEIVAQNTYANERQREIINDAPQWMKDTFWLYPIPGTNQIARIPKPFDLSFAFSNTISRAFDFVYKNDKEAFDGFIKQGFSQASVPVMLTGLAPIVEGMANYSFFRQGPVIPRREEGLEYPDQYDVNTSEAAKVLGKGIHQLTGGTGAFKNFGSPRIIDNTIQGFTGGLGTYATSVIDLFAKGGDDEPERPSKNIDQMPLAKAFLVNQSGGGESLEKLYKMKEQLTKARGSAKQNQQVFTDEGKYQMVKNATKALGEINKQIRLIENTSELTAKEKRSRLDALIEYRNQLSKQAMDNIKNME